MKNSIQEVIPQVNQTVGSSNKNRPWGKFGCIGTGYGKIIANFYPDGESNSYTVVVPENLEKFVLVALEKKLTVLASFEGGIKAYATISDLIIYN
ncbi:hypothetical protein [Aureivirga sp. CE67]|uniref:hypothetical protein n=1 Tax=Aureivirga sp. CE67 TaxID=1788983 RepID=UPI0018CB1F76|nr:hypothetical protein [Aureivirga sp. CE67]